MLDKETLHFRIGLSGSSSKKQPKFKIFVQNIEMVSASLTAAPNETEYFEFDASLDDGESSLVIELTNKSNFDTIVDASGNIAEDLLLNIDSISIDEIDLGSLLWSASNYRHVYPEAYKLKVIESGQELPDSITECVNLGWNGRWILPFNIPFYIWLLENI
jgi:hypothetical protein